MIVKFTREVDIFPDDPNHPDRKLREIDDYVFGWDLIDKEDIRDAHKQELRRILACILAASPLPTQLRSLENGIYFSTPDNRRLFLGFWQVGSAILTRSLLPHELTQFQSAVKQLQTIEQVRAIRLLVAASDAQQDRFRQFVSRLDGIGNPGEQALYAGRKKTFSRAKIRNFRFKKSCLRTYRKRDAR